MPESPQDKIRPTPDVPRATFAPCPVPYAELDVTTNFSFLRGASHADELVLQATRWGYHAIAVTDVNSLAGAVRMYDACRQVKAAGGWAPKLIIGARLQLSDAPDVLVWAPDRASYARLCRLLTLGRRRAPKGECDISLDDLINHSDGLVAALVPDLPFLKTINALKPLREALGDRLSLVVSRVYGDNDDTRLRNIARLGKQFDVPLLATNAVHYHVRERRPLQDVLTCIRHGCTIHEAGLRLFPNGERYLKPPQTMHRLFADMPHAIARGLEIARRCTFELQELAYEYPDEVVPAGKTAGEYLAELTHAGAAKRYPQGMPEKVAKLIEKELTFITQLKWEAYFLTVYDLVKYARERKILCQGRGSAANSAVCYCLGVTSVDPNKIDVLFERFISAARGEPPDIDIDFEHERREEVIQYVYNKYGRERAGMTATVITYRGRSAVRDVGKALGLSLDVVDEMAKRLDWWHSGTLDESQLRESGIDPHDRTVRQLVELTGQLLGFPRHLSQHTGGLVITRGPLCEMVPIENASMADRTVIEWDKDDIDAVGILKVDALALGMLTVISKAFKLLENVPPSPPYSGERAGERGEVCDESMNRAIAHGGNDIHRVCTISGESNDSSCDVHTSPLSPALSPRTGRGRTRYELHTIPSEDPATYDMMCDADTIGVFQIESRAQMSMLPRLRPRKFYDIVIEVAIVRPGPIQGNMVHPYLRRRAGEEEVTYPSKELYETLKNTLGVPLFQEQAMRVVMVAAGFTAEEADKLRRAMAAWRKSGVIDQFYPKIVRGMLERGYTREFAEQTFQQIQGFGEYGFPESHAASFALLVYASAWIKRHHPAVFACALLNSQPMGFYAPAQIVRDAREHGVDVRAVDVNESEWDCTLEDVNPSNEVHAGSADACPESLASSRNDRDAKTQAADGASPKHTWGSTGPSLRLGFREIKGFREDHAKQLVAARKRHGRFASVEQFHQLTRLPVSAVRRLAEADAFGSVGDSRRPAIWNTLPLHDEEAPLFRLYDDADVADASFLPPMPDYQEVMTDYQTTSLSLKRHPVFFARPTLAERGVIPTAALFDERLYPHGRWVKVAGLVLIRQRPGTASGIVFATIEDETGIANLIIKPDIYDKFRPAARHAGLLEAHGYVQREGQVVHVLAKRLFDLSELLAGCRMESRDFH